MVHFREKIITQASQDVKLVITRGRKYTNSFQIILKKHYLLYSSKFNIFFNSCCFVHRLLILREPVFHPLGMEARLRGLRSPALAQALLLIFVNCHPIVVQADWFHSTVVVVATVLQVPEELIISLVPNPSHHLSHATT